MASTKAPNRAEEMKKGIHQFQRLIYDAEKPSQVMDWKVEANAHEVRDRAGRLAGVQISANFMLGKNKGKISVAIDDSSASIKVSGDSEKGFHSVEARYQKIGDRVTDIIMPGSIKKDGKIIKSGDPAVATISEVHRAVGAFSREVDLSRIAPPATFRPTLRPGT